jgi:hypothetical protein
MGICAAKSKALWLRYRPAKCDPYRVQEAKVLAKFDRVNGCVYVSSFQTLSEPVASFTWIRITSLLFIIFRSYVFWK